MTARSKRRLASAVLILLPLALLIANRRLDAGFGLVGTYYSRADWQGESASRIDREIATRSLTPLPRLSRRPSFSARWDGFLHVEKHGHYVFQLISDDGAWLEIDGRLVVDNGGHEGPAEKQGSIELAAGLHVISLRFFQHLWGWRLDLLSAADGREPTVLAGPSLLHVPMGPWTHAAARTLHAVAPFVPLLWLVAAFLLVFDLAAPSLARWPIAEYLGDRALWAVLLVSVVLNASGIWWGLGSGWAPDEILPSQVMDALDVRFSNGWFAPYPPFQYYVLGLLYLPFVAAEMVMELPISPLLHILNRLVSVAMAAGIVVLCYLCAKTLNGRVAGLTAAGLTALLLPFVYYGKMSNLDIPYLFWLCWGILFYIRIIVLGHPAAYVGFAIAAALAIATKDQAYGFFVGPFVHSVFLRYVRIHRQSPAAKTTLADPVVPGALIAGCVTLAVAYNVPFNWTGVVRHVETITKNAGDKYQMFAPTLQGQLELLAQSISQVRFSFGWPAFVLVAAAVVSTLLRPERRTRLWLLLPAASYYCLFIAVVSIVFDRFMLGICILLAVIAGCAVGDWMRSGARTRLAAAWCLAAVGLYSLARAVSLDALMMSDSRYHVEEWIDTHVPPEAVVVSLGPRSYLPAVDWAGRVDEESTDPAAALNGDYVVVNATFAERYPSSSREAAIYERLRTGGGYSLALRHRTPVTSTLSHDPVFADTAETPFTNLDKINPVIEVYRRGTAP